MRNASFFAFGFAVVSLAVACTAGGEDPSSAESPVVAKTCGGIIGATCNDPKQYCEFEPGAGCGFADQQGTCKAKPEVCAQVFDPVCGCDGKTYSNACSAASAGTSVRKQGPCDGGGSSSGGSSGGGSSSGSTGSTLKEGETCGGHTGDARECAPGLFCKWKTEHMCGAADHSGKCERKPEICTKEFMPVCGCDGRTYSNSCMAFAGGTSVAKEGACAP